MFLTFLIFHLFQVNIGTERCALLCSAFSLRHQVPITAFLQDENLSAGRMKQMTTMLAVTLMVGQSWWASLKSSGRLWELYNMVR